MAQVIVTLDDVRAHLRMSDAYTSDNAMLTNIFIPAADRVMQRECAEVLSTQYDEYYDGGDCSIWLRHTPVVSVEMVQEGWGFTNFNLSYVQVNSIIQSNEQVDPMFCYSIDSADEGEITRRMGGNVVVPFVAGDDNVRVVYTAGRAIVPGNIVLAELELIAHWYQGAMQRYSGSTSAYDAVAQDYERSGGIEMTSFGVPERILELVKPDRRTPIIG